MKAKTEKPQKAPLSSLPKQSKVGKTTTSPAKLQKLSKLATAIGKAATENPSASPTEIPATISPESVPQPDTSNKAVETHSYVLSIDPSARQPLVHYSSQSHAFVPVPQEDNILGQCDASKDTETRTIASDTIDSNKEEEYAKEEEKEVPSLPSVVMVPGDDRPSRPEGAQKFTNKNGLFHIDRGLQTSHWPFKERAVSTEDRHTTTSSNSCSPWEIYDAYMMPERRISPGERGRAQVQSTNLRHTMRIFERAMFQNLNQDIISDFKVRK